MEKKYGAIHALVVATVFACLYAFFLSVRSGPGVQDSIVANLEIESLLNLAFVSWIVYMVSIAAFAAIYALFAHALDKLGIYTDGVLETINTCCASASVVLYLATACGLVSWGGF